MKTEGGSVLSASLFIAGTSVGAGMLALPFATGVGGFWPGMLVSALCWLFMLCTGLLFLETTLWMPDGSNLLSMAKRFLGKPGQIIALIGFLYLYYCLLIAYFSGGAPIFAEVINQIFGIAMPPVWAFPVFLILTGGIVMLGHLFAGRINFLLMAGLILSYIALVGVGSREIQPALLLSENWPLAWLAVPILFSAYGYHNIVPSMSTFLLRNGKKIRWAIFLGTLIPFVVYTLWQLIIIGAIPQELLLETIEKGESITKPLELVAHNGWVAITVRFFSFFAIITSVLGVGISMVDFLGDGTKIPRVGWGRLALTMAVFIPPFVMAWTIPGLFFAALHYAGGFGEAILNGLYPILMVWMGRYVYKLKSDWQLPGGRMTLVVLLLVTLAVIGFEVVTLIGR